MKRYEAYSKYEDMKDHRERVVGHRPTSAQLSLSAADIFSLAVATLTVNSE